MNRLNAKKSSAVAHVSDDTIQSIAKRLYEARARSIVIPPVRDELPAGDIAAAYRIQSINAKRRIASGSKIVGRKIGVSSVAVQRQLGIDQPDLGILFDDARFCGNLVSVSRKRLIAPRIEAEIAFILGRDISDPVRSPEGLLGAISEVSASAEIVDSAIQDWQIGIVDTIADNASGGLFVLGEPQPYRLSMQFSALEMKLFRNDEIRSRGIGAATLGDPLAALTWVANAAIELGDPLRREEVVLSGALGPLVPFNEADYRIEIDGFPTLNVRCVP